MAEGLGKGAGLALLAVPMVEASTFTQAQFQRTLSNLPALACRSLNTRSSHLHAAACPACCTAP